MYQKTNPPPRVDPPLISPMQRLRFNGSKAIYTVYYIFFVCQECRFETRVLIHIYYLMGIIPLSYIEGYKCHSSQNKKK